MHKFLRLVAIMVLLCSVLGAQPDELERFQDVAIVFCDQTKRKITRVITLKGAKLSANDVRRLYGQFVLSDTLRKAPDRHSVCLVMQSHYVGENPSIPNRRFRVAWFNNGVVNVAGEGRLHLDDFIELPQVGDEGPTIGSELERGQPRF